MKIQLLRGRDIADSDNEHAPGAIIIDQALQRKFFGAENPLGAHVLINMGDGNPAREYEVVGIVEDVKHLGLTDEPMPTLYGPIPQAPKSAVPFMANNFSLVVRAGIEPEVLASTVRRELGNVDVDVATAGVRPMRQFLAAAAASRRFNMELIGLCSHRAAAGCGRVVCSDRLSGLAKDQRDRDSSRTRRHASTRSAFDDEPGNEINADRCSDRLCWSDSDHASNEEPFVCGSAQRCNDLWRFLCRFDPRSIVGLLYSGTTSNESGSAGRAEVRITCHRPGR